MAVKLIIVLCLQPFSRDTEKQQKIKWKNNRIDYVSVGTNSSETGIISKTEAKK